MLASKVICDDTYSNKSWSIVAQGMFLLSPSLYPVYPPINQEDDAPTHCQPFCYAVLQVPLSIDSVLLKPVFPAPLNPPASYIP